MNIRIARSYLTEYMRSITDIRNIVILSQEYMLKRCFLYLYLAFDSAWGFLCSCTSANDGGELRPTAAPSLLSALLLIMYYNHYVW